MGRSYPITDAQRRSVWDLHGAYADELEAAGVTDWAGLVLCAEEALRDQPFGTVPGERTVTSLIVDEAQDLSCSQARLLRTVAGGGPGSLLLLDDGQQSIYPGGYSLAEAGIVIANRSIALETSFRRDDATTGASGGEVVRWHGAPSDVMTAVVDRVRGVVAGIGTNYGDVAVLSPTAGGARVAAAALVAAGLPVRRLADIEHEAGAPVDAVSVGTTRSARGLEFEQVLLWGFPAETSVLDGAVPEATREASERARRELSVGSTRARDGLWIATTVAS